MDIYLIELKTILVETFSDSAIPDDIRQLKMNDIDQWDSLGNFTLLLAIEEKFNIKFTVEEMSELHSIQSIINVLEKK